MVIKVRVIDGYELVIAVSDKGVTRSGASNLYMGLRTSTAADQTHEDYDKWMPVFLLSGGTWHKDDDKKPSSTQGRKRRLVRSNDSSNFTVIVSQLSAMGFMPRLFTLAFPG